MTEIYTYTDLNRVPGAIATYPESINASGQVAGYFFDSQRIVHGFIYSGGSNGTYTILNDPNASPDTTAAGASINDRGEVLITFGGNTFHSYLYSGGASGTFTRVNDPDPAADEPNLALSLSSSGEVTGFFQSPQGGYHAYLYSDGTFRTIDPPDPTANTLDYPFELFFTAGDHLVGAYLDNQGIVHGVIYSTADGPYTIPNDPEAPEPFSTGILLGNPASANARGDFIGVYANGANFFQIPFEYTASTGTFTTLVPDPIVLDENIQSPSRVTLVGVNATGEVAGMYFTDAGSAGDPPYPEHRAAFVYSGGSNGTYTILNDPDAPANATYWVGGINNSGQVLGEYSSVTGADAHYFVYSSSSGTYTHLDVPGAANGTVVALGLSDNGDVIGNFYDGIASHGFLATLTSDQPTISGTVSDGYIAGATVFADANGDGVLDNGEQSAVTDQQGHFTLSGSGSLVAFGGTDTSTGLAFQGTLSAPTGYTAVTPLSTLVSTIAAQGLGTTAAEQVVMSAFGIPLAPGQRLANLDPIAGTQSGDPAATAAFVAGTQLLDTVTMLSSALSGATQTNFDDAFSAVLNSLGGQASAAASNHTSLNLADAAVISGTIQSAAASLGDAPLNSTLTNTIAAATVAQNQAVNQAVAGGGNILDAVSAVASTAQGSAADTLEGIAKDKTPPVLTITDAVQTSSTVKGVTTITTVVTGHVDTNVPVTLSDTQGGRTSVLSSSITPDATNGNWSYTTTHLPQGTNTLTASATDNAGNTGTSNRLLLGTSGKDTLSDPSAGDVFIGNGGSDTVTGGGNSDIFAFHANFGKETITNFHYGSSTTHDVLDFDHNIPALKGITTDGGLASFLLTHTQDTKNGAVITIDPNDTIVLQGVTNFRTQLTASDFHLI